MESDLVKGALLYRGDGCQTFATDNDDLAVLEWEDGKACRLAEALAEMLKRHVVISSYVRRYGPCSLVVRRMEPIPLTVEAEGLPANVVIRFVDSVGQALEKADTLKVPGVRKSRLDMMEDVANHVARVVRAHLGPVEGLRVRLRFGIPAGGGCLLDMVNPLVCQLGTTDYEALCGLLGGQVT
ncbi:MAG TPA: hypothetical protein VGK74_17675 [Symbiobacteriaceae bacterium]